MGASTAQIRLLLLRQRTRPALLANFVAWPIIWWAMQRWLNGYAYRIEMPLWLYPAAGARDARRAQRCPAREHAQLLIFNYNASVRKRLCGSSAYLPNGGQGAKP
ncbi:hypothetical protein GCM10009075_39660 [Sphingomonas trueperi]